MQAHLKKIKTEILADRLSGLPSEQARPFLARFDRYASDIDQLLQSLYGNQTDYGRHLEAIFVTAADAYLQRPVDLHLLDAVREQNPTWYQHHRMVGGIAYVDLFAGTLHGVGQRIAYLKEMQLTYLHLMLALIEEMFPPNVTYNKPEGGLFLWLRLPEHVDTSELLKHAASQHGVAYVPGAPFHPNGDGRNTLRLNFSFCSAERLEEGMTRLAGVVQHACIEVGGR